MEVAVVYNVYLEPSELILIFYFFNWPLCTRAISASRHSLQHPYPRLLDLRLYVPRHPMCAEEMASLLLQEYALLILNFTDSNTLCLHDCKNISLCQFDTSQRQPVCTCSHLHIPKATAVGAFHVELTAAGASESSTK